MALEVVRSVVKLDHIYAKEEDDVLDLGKDVSLSEAIDSFVSILIKTVMFTWKTVVDCLSSVEHIFLSKYNSSNMQYS